MDIDIIGPSLTYVFYLSLSKKALDENNYSLISILPIVSKVLEKENFKQ